MNSRTKISMIVMCGAGAIAAIGLMSYTPERAARYEKQRRVEAACDQMMSDSAPGDERRLTRSICDKLKAKVEAERYAVATVPVKEEPATSKLPGGALLVTVEPFVVNLAQEGREYYLQTQFNLKVQTPTQVTLLNRNMSRIRSRVLLLLSGTKASEIASTDGQKSLADRIIAVINEPFPGESGQPLVTDLVFTSFKIQD
ncbi:flagellar basal body-associated FliL family protein [Massilia sp. LXY-6]|uniref:flagellar basal body-associated FliL family protein n=1 Tax=Massilia sp. LXY-6 TaxID=3379823 RepID=UPI003EE3F670